MISIPKILLISALVLLSAAYTEENNVLILTAEDFPGIIKEFPLILIEFYAPWCGHCKRLAPIYDEVATELKNAGSPVRVAKVDCDAHPSVKGSYSVQGFPTLLFFNNGVEVKYNGQRSKEFMVNWLSKKTRDPVVAINAEQLSALASDGKVNIVFHGDITSAQGSQISALAVADDFNTYYTVPAGEQPEGTVQIFRPFGEPASTLVDDNVKSWVSLYERPTVYPFNDRTISNVFSEGSSALILFQSAQAGESLNQVFGDAAHQWRVVSGKSLIFTDIPVAAEHYGGLAQYIKIDVTKSPIVFIDGAKRTKFVLSKNPEAITASDITDFAEAVVAGRSKEYKIDEEVKVVEAQAEEEL